MVAPRNLRNNLKILQNYQSIAHKILVKISTFIIAKLQNQKNASKFCCFTVLKKFSVQNHD